jgi:hypothetical protein
LVKPASNGITFHLDGALFAAKVDNYRGLELQAVALFLLVEVGENPKMSGAVFRLVALPEVRVHRQVVADRVLPLVVVGREVGIPVAGKYYIVTFIMKFC